MNFYTCLVAIVVTFTLFCAFVIWRVTNLPPPPSDP